MGWFRVLVAAGATRAVRHCGVNRKKQCDVVEEGEKSRDAEEFSNGRGSAAQRRAAAVGVARRQDHTRVEAENGKSDSPSAERREEGSGGRGWPAIVTRWQCSGPQFEIRLHEALLVRHWMGSRFPHAQIWWSLEWVT